VAVRSPMRDEVRQRAVDVILVRTRHRSDRGLRAFPTRRSSDLRETSCTGRRNGPTAACSTPESSASRRSSSVGPENQSSAVPRQIGRAHVELQSLRHLVCRLLLEKKNVAASALAALDDYGTAAM